MCMIGVTIITTLILMLQVGRTAAATMSTTNRMNQKDPADQLAALKSVQAALRQRLSDAENARQVNSEVRLAQDVAAIDQTAVELDRLKQEIAKSHDELVKIAQEARADQRALIALELMRRRDELQVALQEISHRRRITYIVDASEQRRPLVTEISSARVVVSAEQSSGAPEAVPAGDPAATAQAIIAIFRSQPDVARRYLLLVLKPSGIPTYLRLIELLRADPALQDIQVGLDLIPEDHWTNDEFPARDVSGGGTP